MKLGYTNQTIKDKQDRGQYLSKEEQDYLDLEALQAAEQFVMRHGKKGAHFMQAAAGNISKLADQLRDKELTKQGKQPPREPHSPERAPDYEENKDPMNVFGSIYGGK